MILFFAVQFFFSLVPQHHISSVPAASLATIYYVLSTQKDHDAFPHCLK